jgi:hypothetical protein
VLQTCRATYGIHESHEVPLVFDVGGDERSAAGKLLHAIKHYLLNNEVLWVRETWVFQQPNNDLIYEFEFVGFQFLSLQPI